jgi:uncharacterized membrane protein (UPF0127 family)
MVVIFNIIYKSKNNDTKIDTTIFSSKEIHNSATRNLDDHFQNTATNSLRIGGTQFFASVARTPNERAQGLSGTSFIPSNFAKLFVFDEEGYWGIWMKDMNYPIDIIWLDSNKIVVYSETAVSPESYPEVFIPSTPAQYVIELRAGTVKDLNITYGQIIEFEV